MGTRKLSHRASKPMVQESNGRTGGLSRRDFLKAAGTVAGGTALFLVDACSPISSLVEPTASIMPSKTLEATGTPTRNPTSTATQTEIPTRAATWTPVPPPKELPPPAKTITIPSILDVNGSISFEITGWYDRAKEKGEKKIRDFDGEIVLEKDPKVLENFRAKGYDGKLLRHTLK